MDVLERSWFGASGCLGLWDVYGLGIRVALGCKLKRILVWSSFQRGLKRTSLGCSGKGLQGSGG